MNMNRHTLLDRGIRPRFLAVSISKRVFRFSGYATALVLLALAFGCDGFFFDPILTTLAVTPPTPSIVAVGSLQN
jgi:hypothetical protein